MTKRTMLRVSALGALIVSGAALAQDGEGPLLLRAGPGDYSGLSQGGLGLSALEYRGQMSPQALDMPETEAELNALLAQMAAHWPHPVPQPATVKVAMGLGYQAVTYPDGTILVDIAALQELANPLAGATGTAPSIGTDQELMYMLGHEYSHYAMAHHASGDAAKGLSALGAGVPGLLDDGNAQAHQASAQANLLGAVVGSAISGSWGRRQEDEADFLGLDLIKAAGVEGPYYGDVFSKISMQRGLSEAIASNLESSLESSMTGMLTDGTLENAVAGNGDIGDSLLSGIGRGLLSGAAGGVADTLGRDHRDPDDRLEEVREYEAAAYPAMDVFAITPESTVALDRIRALPEFQEARTVTTAYYQSLQARAQGDLIGAQAAIDVALASRFGAQAPIRLEAARVAEASGNWDAAMGHLNTAAADPTPAPDAYRMQARLFAQSGRAGDAYAALDAAEARLTDRDYFLPARVEVAAITRDNSAMLSYRDACHATGREALIADCDATLEGVMQPAQSAADPFNPFGAIDSTSGSPLPGVGDAIGGLFD